jgi:hypothetical protein
MEFSTAIFAYLGPETILPMTSAVAGVVGVVMLLGRGSLRWVSRTVRGLVSKVKPRRAPRASTRKIGKGPVGPSAATARERTRS